jgi:hypothetical protein
MQKDWGWKKRPCRICGRWFTPHPRLKDRQKTCADAQCKREWHRRKCAQWNKDNADYFKSNYLQKKLETTLVCKSRYKSGLPLAFVQEVIGIQPLVILEYLVQLLRRRFQEVIRMEVAVRTGQMGRLLRGGFQDAIDTETGSSLQQGITEQGTPP